MKVREIPLEKIFIKKNIRTDTDEELGEQMESMNRLGLLQPIGVYQRGERYEIVFGHRRFRAAQMNNDATIACNVLDPAVVSENDIPLIKLQENMVRKQLSTEEILAAADEIKRRRPELTDKHIDVMLGKRPGYLGFRRSLSKAYDWCAAHGLDKKKLEAMSMDEVLELRARLEGEKLERKKSKGAFHRPGLVPATGFTVIDSRGPNIVVICSCKDVKLDVLKSLRTLAKEKAG